MAFVFTLRYQLPVGQHDAEAAVEQLGAAGCDDALVGVGIPGRLALEFTREGPDAWTAVMTALEDVRRALPSATLIEAAPDLVGLSDVAELLGVSRQAMRKLMLAHPGSFPPPVHEGTASLWHLADLLSWLRQRGPRAISEDLLGIARATMLVNAANWSRRLPRDVSHALEPLVG